MVIADDTELLGEDDETSTARPPKVEAPLPFSGERLAITGTLASMTHREAAEVIERQGGQYVQHVSQQTTLLVVGEEGWPLEADGQPSVKLLQAQAIQQRGGTLRILSESEWLAAAGLEARSRQSQQFTPAMLSQLLDVSVHDIRRWERRGLIHPVRRVMRLPYFDYTEVAAARRLAGLIDAGVSIDVVARSLDRLQAVMPAIHQPLGQLQILAQGRHVLYRDATGWLESSTGQRRLPFDDTEAAETAAPAESDADVLPLSSAPQTGQMEWTAEQFCEYAVHLAEQGELAAAVEAYRTALIERADVAQIHFELADVLYRMGRVDAAIERFYVAVEQDHDFIEAWTQIGCLLVETRDVAGARHAFEIALDLHPDFPDAHFHLAQLMEAQGESMAARQHWLEYLRHDLAGPWADVARRHLGMVGDDTSDDGNDDETGNSLNPPDQL